MPLQHTAVTKQHFSYNHKILDTQMNAIKYKSLFHHRPSNPHKKATQSPVTAQQIPTLHITVQLCAPDVITYLSSCLFPVPNSVAYLATQD